MTPTDLTAISVPEIHDDYDLSCLGSLLCITVYDPIAILKLAIAAAFSVDSSWRPRGC